MGVYSGGRGKRAAVAALALGMSLLAVAAASAYEPVGSSDTRISSVSTDGDPFRDAVELDSAYNSTANEYLVVWEADGLATDDEYEIFGQRVSAAGAELGSDFRISNVGADGDADRDGQRPTVAYNSTANEYLVTWRGDGLATNNDLEIFGQRVSAAGAEVGSDFRISNIGADDERLAIKADVAYNSTANEYLVTWDGDGLATELEFEVFGQRVSAAGAEVGSDFRISDVGADGDADRGGGFPAVAYNSTANEYLVTWTADDLVADQELEIFGQRVSAAGAEVGSDFRISNVGTDGDASHGANVVAVAYSSTANEYLVTWDGDGLATDDEYEIFGQRVSAAGAEVGSDFRISNVGTDGDASPFVGAPAVAYSSTANEYLVTWAGDGLGVDREVFGQRVSAAGSAVGSDFQISCFGAEGDTSRVPVSPTPAYNSAADEYMVTWVGDGIAQTDGEFEVFGRRLAIAPSPGPCPASGPGDGGPGADTTPPDTTITAGPKKKSKKKKATFEFSAEEPGASFQCSLDGAPFSPCTSPLSVKVKKKPKKHSFEVRATDSAGNVDPTPAAQSWKVKKKKK